MTNSFHMLKILGPFFVYTVLLMIFSNVSTSLMSTAVDPLNALMEGGELFQARTRAACLARAPGASSALPSSPLASDFRSASRRSRRWW